MALGGKKGELHIYSHSDLKMMMDPLMRFMIEFTDFKVVYHPLNFHSQAVVYEDSKITVDSFPLKHRIPCCGFLFREKPKELHLRGNIVDYLEIPIKDRVALKSGADYHSLEGKIILNHELTFPPEPARSYAFCTDTLARKQIIPIIRDIDLLYHEATFLNEMSDLALKTYHTTAEQAARLASEAGVKKLIIGHFSSRYKNVNPLVDEARQVFTNTFPANDGDRFAIES